jgi:hypothetical protein
MPRPYRSDRHLWSVAESEAGAIAVWPQTSDRLYFDIAKASHLPANLPTSDNAARTLEENIARHEAALEILRANLAACDEGEPFTQFPELPTKGR